MKQNYLLYLLTFIVFQTIINEMFEITGLIPMLYFLIIIPLNIYMFLKYRYELKYKKTFIIILFLTIINSSSNGYLVYLYLSILIFFPLLIKDNGNKIVMIILLAPIVLLTLHANLFYGSMIYEDSYFNYKNNLVTYEGYITSAGAMGSNHYHLEKKFDIINVKKVLKVIYKIKEYDDELTYTIHKNISEGVENGHR